MQNIALAILHDEHRSLAAVVHGLRYVIQTALRSGVGPDFPLLWAMLSYIDRFPKRLHHPKEEIYIFGRLQKRTGEADSVIAELRRQHLECDQQVRDLERALGEYEGGAANGLAAFSAALEDFATKTWAHMELEESVLLPLARQYLDASDWVEIGLAFGKNGDPRFGEDHSREFRETFSRIVNLAPPPIGLGPLSAPDRSEP